MFRYFQGSRNSLWKTNSVIWDIPASSSWACCFRFLWSLDECVSQHRQVLLWFDYLQNRAGIPGMFDTVPPITGLCYLNTRCLSCLLEEGKVMKCGLYPKKPAVFFQSRRNAKDSCLNSAFWFFSVWDLGSTCYSMLAHASFFSSWTLIFLVSMLHSGFLLGLPVIWKWNDMYLPGK